MNELTYTRCGDCLLYTSILPIAGIIPPCPADYFHIIPPYSSDDQQHPYIAIGIDLNGRKDVLGMWVGENESAKFLSLIHI